MVRLISLGSSFAAGSGIPPQADVDAGRSVNNYPNYFARKLGLDPNDRNQFLDLTVSGATLPNLISEPQDTGNKVFPPQLDLLPDLAEGEDSSDVVVTITGHTLKNTLWGRIVSYFMMGKDEKHQFEHPTVASPQEISNRFETILDKVEQKYPNCTVYLVEYFTMCSTNTKGGKDVAWDQAQVDKYIEQAHLIQSLYEQAAQGRDRVHIIPLAEASQSHGLGSSQPWVFDGSILYFF